MRRGHSPGAYNGALFNGLLSVALTFPCARVQQTVPGWNILKAGESFTPTETLAREPRPPHARLTRSMAPLMARLPLPPNGTELAPSQADNGLILSRDTSWAAHLNLGRFYWVAPSE